MALPLPEQQSISMISAGRLRQRAVAEGLPAQDFNWARTSGRSQSSVNWPRPVVAAALARPPSAGRAHPPRGSRQQRRGAAPRQQRRAASASRIEPQRSSWNNDNHTVGFFDSSLLKPGRRGEASAENRSSMLVPQAGSDWGCVAPASGASMSVRSTPRRSPHRSPHRHWAALHHRLQVSGRLDLSGVAQVIDNEAFHRTTLEPGGESSVDEFDALGSSSSSACMPLQEPQVVPVAPGPVQLEVVHIQRAREVHQFSDLCIVLPDGTSLGAASPVKASAGTETVVLMPGGVASGTPGRHEVLDQSLRLEAPFAMRDKVQSVSERLSLLLGPPQLQPKLAILSAAATAPSLSGRELLRNNQLAVLSQADVFVDAIMQHILADTSSALNKLPCGSGPASAKETQKSTKEIVTRRDLAHAPVREVVDQLHDLESTLLQRYSGQEAHIDVVSHVINSQPQSLACAAFATSLFSTEIEPNEFFHTHPTQGTHKIRPSMRKQTSAWQTSVVQSAFVLEVSDELHSAALPQQRVQEIEKYRTRFAQHCLASREAGIDRSHPGDAVSVATWTIWPHLADAIVLAAVESAIEEVHEAMESHVEELVVQEVAGLH